MLSAELFKNSLLRLLPTGSAFRLKVNGNIYKIIESIAELMNEAATNSKSILSKIIPDGLPYFDDTLYQFNESDASHWELVLGINVSSAETLENRMKAIYVRMHDENVSNHKIYIQDKLRAAGFDVTVFEYDEIKDFITAYKHSTTTIHGYNTRHGALQVPDFTTHIANTVKYSDEIPIEMTLDVMRNSFYIAGATFSDYVNIPIQRMDTFRDMVLRMKPTHRVAFVRNVPPVEIVDFDYLKVQYLLTGRDLDTKTYFYNTGLPLDGKAVGYGFGSTYVTDPYNKYLEWGGDNQSGTENVLVDFKLFHNNNPSIVTSEVKINAHWFTGYYPQDVTIRIVGYKGGKMEKSGYDFINTDGGEIVGQREFTVEVTGNYEDLGILTYNSLTKSVILTQLKY